MNKYLQHAAWAAVLLVAAGGCNSTGSSDDSGGTDMNAIARSLDRPPAAAPKQSQSPEASQSRRTKQPKAEPAKQPQVVAEKQAQPPAQPPRPRASELITTPGQPQVVGQRRYRNTIEGPMSYYGAIASARMVMKDRILYAQIRKSTDLFEATNSRYPKDTAEFMDKIINENMIELPELPPNQEYFYDPTDHELKIGELREQPPAGGSPQQ
jgi:hypothetical protein